MKPHAGHAKIQAARASTASRYSLRSQGSDRCAHGHVTATQPVKWCFLPLDLALFATVAQGGLLAEGQRCNGSATATGHVLGNKAQSARSIMRMYSKMNETSQGRFKTAAKRLARFAAVLSVPAAELCEQAALAARRSPGSLSSCLHPTQRPYGRL